MNAKIRLAEMPASRTAPVVSAVLLMTGTAAPTAAQVPDSAPPGQTGTQVVPGEAVDPGPAAEQSGWMNIGVWGIVVLVVLVALVAWFAFFRPRSPRPKR